MTIAGKINALFIAAGVLLTMMFSGFTAVRDHDAAPERVVDAARAGVQSHSELQRMLAPCLFLQQLQQIRV